MDQVGAFTRLAEEKRIKVIVRPISSASTEERTRIYDFASYRDLTSFQDKMREAYGYIEGHVKYMNLCKQNKADKGGYDGRVLPPGMALKGQKKERVVVIYEPWAKEMRKLALRAQALSWDMGKLAREVAAKEYLFPEIPEEDKERYLFKTKLHHIPGVGYKPRDPSTLRDWFTNIMFIGWWQPDKDKPDMIIDHHPAILDFALFAEGYAEMTGYTLLEGEPVEKNRSITRLKETREAPLPLVFHGKLLVKSPWPGFNAFITPDEGEGKAYYVGICNRPADLRRDKFLHLPGEPFDNIVIARLKALEAADKNVREKVKTTLEQVYDRQSEDFVSIHEQLAAIEKQLKENARKRMKTSVDDPMYDMLEEEKDELIQKQKSVEAKKERLGIIDSPEEIAQLHALLGNFEAVWPTFDLEHRQRAFNLLINRIEIEVVSKHWLRLTIDWLDAICPRLDIAYIWKAGSSRSGAYTEEEYALLRQYYYDTPTIELLKLLPKRTWAGIQSEAERQGIKRKNGALLPRRDFISRVAGYSDFCPDLDDTYLFGDYETTLRYINIADKNTSRKGDNPLYAIWIMPTKGEDLVTIIQMPAGGTRSRP